MAALGASAKEARDTPQLDITSRLYSISAPELADVSSTFSSPVMVTTPMASPDITNTTCYESIPRLASPLKTELGAMMPHKIYGLLDLLSMRDGARDISSLKISKEAPPGESSP